MLFQKIKSNIPLIIILTIAFLVRSYNLDTTPALNSDEAALAYNAYSLIKTGKDEHGIAWPLHFKSFGDFKPGGYVYLAIPFVKFLGLNTLAIRLPNLILSIISIYFFNKLINLLSTKKLGYYSTIVLSLSPWHIHFSRGAWESCTALSFTILGLYFFYSYLLNLKPYIHLCISVLFFSLSLYTYHSARLIVPLLGVFLLVQNFKKLTSPNQLKNTIFASVLAITLITPVTKSFISSGGTARFGGVGLTADSGPLWRANELINQHDNTKIINRVMHNKRVLYLLSWLEKYTSHFDLNFLFVNGDQVPRSKTPQMGQMHLIELPIFLIGLLSLLNCKEKRSKQLIFFLLLLTPIASSLTFQAPSALRALTMVIPLSIIIGHGISEIADFLKYKHYILLLTTYLYFFCYYLYSYYSLYPKVYPQAWQYQFNQVIPIIEQNKTKYQYIYLTNKYDQPYILYLFYSQYEPSSLHPQIKLTSPDQFGFSTVSQIDNIHFSIPAWQDIPPNSMVISSDEPIPTNPNEVINFANGQSAFKIYIK